LLSEVSAGDNLYSLLFTTTYTLSGGIFSGSEYDTMNKYESSGLPVRGVTEGLISSLAETNEGNKISNKKIIINKNLQISIK
jgi:hypothetical protein